MSIGGKRTTENSIDPDLKREALETLNLADQAGRIGYIPYTGPTVAALTPGQVAGIENTNAAASAFGLNTYTPTMTGGEAIPGTGATGYSGFGLYSQALANMDPEKRAMIEAILNPPAADAGAGQTVPAPVTGVRNRRPRPVTGGIIRQPGSQMPPLRGEAPSTLGFTSIADMFDGGGPGQSGDTFKGPFSFYSNALTTPRTRG